MKPYRDHRSNTIFSLRQLCRANIKAEGSEEKRSSDKEKLCLIINLESQAKDNPGYPLIKRALYYSSRLVAKQKMQSSVLRIQSMEK